MSEVKYNMEKRSKAYRFFVLRMAVALYICCLAFKTSSAEDTTMSKTLCWIIGGVFMAAAIGFVIYANKRFHIDLDDAKLKDDEAAETAEDAEAEEDDDSEEQA